MSAWDDRTPEEETGVRGTIVPYGPGEMIVADDLPGYDDRFHNNENSVAPVDFWWRQVGTDIEVRVRPDFLASGPPWQYQYAPTGLLTIHLAGNPADAEPAREVPDPLEPIETPGPTFIRRAEWDEETQSWRTDLSDLPPIVSGDTVEITTTFTFNPEDKFDG